MNALQVFRYNDTSIEFELIDGELYANATAMCQANGKRPAKWLENEGTKRYVAALEAKSEKRTPLIISKSGGSGGGGATWIHEKLILKLAQWLDVDFEIWCDERVQEVMRGERPTALPASQDELILMLAQRNVTMSKDVSMLKEQMQEVRQIQQEAKAELLALPAPTEPMVDMATEDKVRRIVNTYASAHVTPVADVWRSVYSELYYRYKIQVGGYKLNPGESKLQALKRHGHIDKLYVVASNVLQQVV